MENNKLPKIFVTDGYKVEHKKFIDNLVLVVGAGKTHLHHMMPAHFSPLISLHDVLEDRIGSTQNVLSEVFEQNLDWSKLIVSLQDNNQKD